MTQWMIVCSQDTAPAVVSGGLGCADSANYSIIAVPAPATFQQIPSGSPFDPAIAGEFFGFAFASTVFVWLTALGAGAILKFVKSL